MFENLITSPYRWYLFFGYLVVVASLLVLYVYLRYEYRKSIKDITSHRSEKSTKATLHEAKN